LRALILTAGLGTRLRPLTYSRAKAAVPVNGEPIVRRIIAWLTGQGIGDLVLNLHHNPASIAAVVGDGRDLGARVRYSWENPVLGSGGGPRRALPLLVDRADAGPTPDAFLIVNGDTLTDLDVRDLIARHQASGALVTMALIRNPQPDVYGGVLVENGWVTGFSRRGATRENYHFVGVQVASARAFERLTEGVPAESVSQLYPELIGERAEAVAAHVVDARFDDVGTPADYLQTSLALAAAEGDRLVSSRGVRIDAAARLHRTAVWDGVAVAAGAQLDQCIVCDGVSIPGGARYARCAIVPFAGQPLRDGERRDGDLLLRTF
jgi:NDP-sugar pyrophosphorylase family protein